MPCCDVCTIDGQDLPLRFHALVKNCDYRGGTDKDGAPLRSTGIFSQASTERHGNSRAGFSHVDRNCVGRSRLASTFCSLATVLELFSGLFLGKRNDRRAPEDFLWNIAEPTVAGVKIYEDSAAWPVLAMDSLAPHAYFTATTRLRPRLILIIRKCPTWFG